MMDKKGILMPLIVILTTVLLGYAAYSFVGGRVGPEGTSELGEMMKDIYVAEGEARDVTIYLDNLGEYLLLDAIKKRIIKGMPVDENCEAFYETEKCFLDFESFINSVAKEVSFEKQHSYLEDKSISEGDYEFFTEQKEGYIFLVAKSDKLIDFGDSQKGFVFKKSIRFTSKLKFNLTEYENMLEILGNEKLLACLVDSKDEEVVDNLGAEENKHLPESCLIGYNQFSDVKKAKNVLSFNYEVKGVLFEESFKGPIRLDLVGFQEHLAPEDIGTLK